MWVLSVAEKIWVLCERPVRVQSGSAVGSGKVPWILHMHWSNPAGHTPLRVWQPPGPLRGNGVWVYGSPKMRIYEIRVRKHIRDWPCQAHI